MSDSSLFESLSGAAKIESLVEDFYRRLPADPALAPFFDGADIDKLHRMQRQFFSVALGGSVLYSGRPIAHAHQHLWITLADYQRFVQHFFETLAQVNLTEQECYEMVRQLNLYTNDVVSAGSGIVG